jgi:hypothetical protein
VRFLSRDDALERAGIDRVVADEVDGRDAGAHALFDLEDDADTAGIRFLEPIAHCNIGEAPLLIGETDAFGIGGDHRRIGFAAGRDVDHGDQLRVGEALVALEEDGGDERIVLRVGGADPQQGAGGERRCDHHRKRQEHATHKLCGINHSSICL